MELPDEMLLKIFSYLGPLEKSVICMAVCRRWGAVAQTACLWRVLTFDKSFSSLKLAAFLRLPYVRGVVTSLELAKGHDIPDVALPRVERMVVARNHHVSSVTNFQVFNVENFPALRTLRLTYAERLDWKVFFDLATELKKLKPNLVIEFGKMSIFWWIDWHCCAPTYVESFKKCFTVTDLVIRCSDFLTATEEQRVALEEYTSFSTSIVRLNSDYLTFVQFIAPFQPSVTHLSLYCMDLPLERVREMVEVLPTICSRLKEIELCGHVFSLSAQGLVTPAPFLWNLERLCIKLLLVTDDDYSWIIMAWGGLKALSISFDNVRLDCLHRISESNPELEELYLEDEPYEYLVSAEPRMGDPKVVFPCLKKAVLPEKCLPLISLVSAPMCTSVSIANCSVDHPLVLKYQTQIALAFPAAVSFILPCLEQGLGLLKTYGQRVKDVSFSNFDFGCRTINVGVPEAEGVRYRCDVMRLKDLSAACPSVRKLQLDFNAGMQTTSPRLLAENLKSCEKLQEVIINSPHGTTINESFKAELIELCKPASFSSEPDYYRKGLRITLNFFPAPVRQYLALQQGFEGSPHRLAISHATAE